ncbi:MAG: phosphoribosylanthranilate isomerase [Pirellulales bacterium]
MFRIKICGVTSLADALAAAAAGADAIGFNFHHGSRRFIDPLKAAAIAESLPPEIVKVGVFVNLPAHEVRQTADAVPLDLVQLHGDETPDYLANLAGFPVMRAFRCGPGCLGSIPQYIGECRTLFSMPRMILFDALVAGAYGGTGQRADWGLAAECRKSGLNAPLVLAGGLTPDNVAEAIRTVRPNAVDSASGVESAPGRKDPARMAAFVEAALAEFARLDRQAGLDPDD